MPFVDPVCLSWLVSTVVVGFAGSWCGTELIEEDLEELVLCYHLQNFWVVICVIRAANAFTDPYYQGLQSALNRDLRNLQLLTRTHGN